MIKKKVCTRRSKISSSSSSTSTKSRERGGGEAAGPEYDNETEQHTITDNTITTPSFSCTTVCLMRRGVARAVCALVVVRGFREELTGVAGWRCE